MEKDIEQIVKSWTDVEAVIHGYMHREEKMSIAQTDTDISSGHQFEALVIIAIFDIHNVTKIAQTIGCSKSAVSIMLSKMMSKNLVTKNYGHNEKDNRSIYIDITDKGKEMLESFMETRIKVIADMYDKMSEKIKAETIEGYKCFLERYGNVESFITDVTEKMLDKQQYDKEKREYLLILARFIAGRISKDKTILEKPQLISKNLTWQQIGILKAIEYNKQNTVSRLVKEFGTSVSTVSVNVSRLARAGFIVKEYGKTTDNRETILSITPKAKEELQNIADKFFEELKSNYNKMNKKEQDLLRQGIEHFDNVVKYIKAEGNK